MGDRRVAVLTGAGRGIGAACAREMARRGFSVVLMSLSGSAAAVAAELDGHAVTGSVEKTEDLAALVDLAMTQHGRIDAVVNSTGNPTWSTSPERSSYELSPDGYLLEIPDEDWHAMMDLQFLPVVRMARIVTPHMQAAGGGSIVNISSAFAVAPCVAYPFGATVRRSLTGFAKLYASRYGRDGIRMTNVMPGFLDNHSWPAELVGNIPLQRAGTLEEVARTVGFLADSDSSYITGQDIMVDGGTVR
ncbi:NAD(P)-dependent dehydrogenase (short-subunit alcohol dehydrogenase family) [Rhodoligotrophos appendicifer]|uniref:SDR family oxidoreductase n=1 Tax=Rhodoligotrophos appendicifer TaxID=987056 RepID=UPI0011854ECE|nr:SDR family oxidoreductase [Rhodoligotrophos appendicifer]